jgi:hypothetical protein
VGGQRESKGSYDSNSTSMVYLNHTSVASRLSPHNGFMRWKANQQEDKTFAQSDYFNDLPITRGGIQRLDGAVTNNPCDKQKPQAKIKYKHHIYTISHYFNCVHRSIRVPVKPVINMYECGLGSQSIKHTTIWTKMYHNTTITRLINVAQSKD